MCPAKLALVVIYHVCPVYDSKVFHSFLYTHGLISLTLSKMYVMMPSTRQKRHDNDKHDSDKAGLFQSQCHFLTIKLISP